MRTRESVDTSCATCQYLIKEDPFYWCGLESGENFYVDVAFDSKPLEIQPEWCLLREKDGCQYNDRCD